LKAFRNPQPSWGFSVHKKNLPANWQVSEQIVQPDLDRVRKICSNKFRFLSAKNHHFELVIEG
ncbi:hypothetical protein, partial [Escherichia coli]|uniref:hypothetical protein n=1 Tax=Escherichia coli TaxID=562 RepID=UPI00357135CB